MEFGSSCMYVVILYIVNSEGVEDRGCAFVVAPGIMSDKKILYTAINFGLISRPFLRNSACRLTSMFLQFWFS